MTNILGVIVKSVLVAIGIVLGVGVVLVVLKSIDIEKAVQTLVSNHKNKNGQSAS